MAVDVAPLELAALLVGVAFLPSIVYAVWVRNLERHGREPWVTVAKAFLWGAIGGVVLAVLLSMFLLEGASRPDALPALGLTPLVVAAVVVAPLAEELAKAVGLRWVRDPHPEPEDGLVYGAAAGFGFAATENLFYGLGALMTGGIAGFVATAVARSISSALLHGCATALVGLGMWRARAGLGGGAGVVGLYGVAVLLHASFNLAASTEVIGGLVYAVASALLVFGWVRRRVRRLDLAGDPGSGLPPS